MRFPVFVGVIFHARQRSFFRRCVIIPVAIMVLLVDPAYGRREFLDAAETLVQQLGLAEEAITPQEHPLF